MCIFILFQVVEECKTIGRANAKFGYIVGDMAQFDTVPKKIVEVSDRLATNVLFLKTSLKIGATLFIGVVLF